MIVIFQMCSFSPWKVIRILRGWGGLQSQIFLKERMMFNRNFRGWGSNQKSFCGEGGYGYFPEQCNDFWMYQWKKCIYFVKSMNPKPRIIQFIQIVVENKLGYGCQELSIFPIPVLVSTYFIWLYPCPHCWCHFELY